MRKTKTGDYKALPNQPAGNGHKITDWNNFSKFVEIHGDKTQVEMAQLWPEQISERTISRALKKIGFSRKKKLTVTLERDEAKRQKFREEIAQYTPLERVYIDEAGMDNREDYGYGYNAHRKTFLCP